MPFFAYQAKDKQGNPVNGELEAQDDNAVADTLLRRGLIPLSIKQSNGNKEGEKSAITTFFQPKVSLDELIIFFSPNVFFNEGGYPNYSCHCWSC
jgi:MSHA biogenesis protein MshG